jgi:hypothetical protein
MAELEQEQLREIRLKELSRHSRFSGSFVRVAEVNRTLASMLYISCFYLQASEGEFFYVGWFQADVEAEPFSVIN